MEDNGAKGARVFILEGTVETETVKTGEKVSVSPGEMAQVSVNETGETEIQVLPFAEEYVPSFVLEELEGDGNLSAAVLAASGLDVLDPPDPAERLMAECQEIIASHPVLDDGMAEGASYMRDGVTYAAEGLSEALYVNLDGDGTKEMVLVTQKASPLGMGPITRVEVYGEIMGRLSKLDDAEISGDANSFGLYQKDGGVYLALENSNVDTPGNLVRLYQLADGRLALIETISDPYYENEQLFAAYTPLDPLDYMQDVSVPALPEDVQRKNSYLSYMSYSQYASYDFAALCDVDGDGAEELLLLEDAEYGYLYLHDWGNTQPPTLLQSDIIYAKLIDMNQDGTEELLLLTTDGMENSFQVYSWGPDGIQAQKLEYRAYYQEYNVYREKETGSIYVGGPGGGGSRGEHTTLCSLSDTLAFSWYDHSEEINLIWDIANMEGRTISEDDPAISAEERAAEQELQEYSTQLARFELIESISPGSYEWQETLRHTVEEVRQQLMER